MRSGARAAVSVILALAVGVPALTSGAAAQDGAFGLVGPSRERERVPVARHRGYAAVPAASLERIGWSVEVESRTVRARLDEDVLLVIHPGNPFLTWNDEVLQLVAAPYFFGEELYVPLQLLTDLLPTRLEEDYGTGPDSRSLLVRRAERWTPEPPARRSPPGVPEARTVDGGGGGGVVVVVVDPGHGGKDVGAQGPGGVVEKEITLGVARALARELEGEPGIEVHLTRDGDSFVPLWERGEKATAWKGDRPGVFISLHANAIPRARSIRGFETYFLSEARTEHERRVAALENAPLQLETPGDEGASGENPDLSFILNDLRNRDHQHWSALLAEEVQRRLAPVHPGPDRGVKQGPFAVITNALMPSVLIELGFITNGSEARLLSRKSFQEDAAGALAAAVRDFFRRYPPGTEVTAGGSR